MCPNVRKYDPLRHHRQSMRLFARDYSMPGSYFLTICTYNRDCLLGTVVDEKMILSEFGQIVRQTWLDMQNHYARTQLDEYIIMPNHIHAIVTLIGDPVGAIHESPLQDVTIRRRMLLSKIVGRFKMNSARQINAMRKTHGIPVWQRNFYDHIIRDDQDLDRIREYITSNPTNWHQDDENPERPRAG